MECWFVSPSTVKSVDGDSITYYSGWSYKLIYFLDTKLCIMIVSFWVKFFCVITFFRDIRLGSYHSGQPTEIDGLWIPFTASNFEHFWLLMNRHDIKILCRIFKRENMMPSQNNKLVLCIFVKRFKALIYVRNDKEEQWKFLWWIESWNSCPENNGQKINHHIPMTCFKKVGYPIETSLSFL